MNLGQAPEGWAPESDVRYLDASVVWLALYLVAVTAAGLIFSPDPHAFFLHEGLLISLLILLLILLLLIWIDNTIHVDGEQTTFLRIYRVQEPDQVFTFVGKRLPRKFYPLNRFSEDLSRISGYEDEKVRKVTLVLGEQEHVKNKVTLLVKYDRHLVEARVTTSDRDSMATKDLLDALDDYFGRHRMDWLSVDVDEDSMLLMGMGMKERQDPDWHSSFSRDGLANVMLAVLVLMGVFWLPLAWAVLHPVPGWVMNAAIGGIFLKPLFIAIFLIAMEEYAKGSAQGLEFERTRTFHASPWYVTAAIQEGLEKARWPYRTRTRVDPTAHMRSECFDIQDRALTIDVAWADKDTDPNWTTVRIRSPTVVGDLQSVQDLVRNSVFGRYRELGLK